MSLEPNDSFYKFFDNMEKYYERLKMDKNPDTDVLYGKRSFVIRLKNDTERKRENLTTPLRKLSQLKSSKYIIEDNHTGNNIESTCDTQHTLGAHPY